MNHSQAARLAGIAWATLLAPLSVLAYGNTDDIETPHNLTHGAGYVAPALANSLVENPAGLSYAQTFEIIGSAQTNSLSLMPLGGSLGFYLGNGFVGGAVNFDLAGDTAMGTQGAASAGIGVEIPAVNMAFGVSGSYNIWNATTHTSLLPNNAGWGINAGVIVNPKQEFRVGVTGNQLGSGYETAGIGLAYSPSSWATIAVDGSKSMRGSGIAIKPGLGLHFYNFQMSLGWGIPLDVGVYQMRLGPEVTVGGRFSHSIHAQAAYNHNQLFQLRLIFEI